MTFVDKSDAFEHTKAKKKKQKKNCNELFQGPRRNLFRRFCYFAVNSFAQALAYLLVCLCDDTSYGLLFIIENFLRKRTNNKRNTGGVKENERHTSYRENSRCDDDLWWPISCSRPSKHDICKSITPFLRRTST